MGLGVTVGNEKKVSIILYTDNIAIVLDNNINLLLMLKKLPEWCQCWCLTINSDKSQIVKKFRFLIFCQINKAKYG